MIKTFITASLFLFGTDLFAQEVSASLNAANKPTIAETKQRATSGTDESESYQELSETKSLKLQRHMDRRAKTMETLSNTMNKQSETSGTIIENMK